MTDTEATMNTYLVHYSTGTNRHDEKRYTRKVEAPDILTAARRADRIKTARRAIITAIELDGPAFPIRTGA